MPIFERHVASHSRSAAPLPALRSTRAHSVELTRLPQTLIEVLLLAACALLAATLPPASRMPWTPT
eukprot:4763065-Pleurochrysis_carterae.AAC.4